MFDCCKAALCCYLITSVQGRGPLGRCLTAVGFVSAAEQRRAGRPSAATQPPKSPVAFLLPSQPRWKRSETAKSTFAQSITRPRLYVYVLARACVRCFWICRCFIHTRRNKSAAVMLVEQRCAFVRLYVFGVRKQSHSAYEIAPLPPLFSGRRVDFATPPPFPHTHTHFLREVERHRSKGGEGGKTPARCAL